MRTAVLTIGVLVGTVVATIFVVDAFFLQEDEVVTLWTFDEDGRRLETQVWIVPGTRVDGGGEDSLWLSAHSPRTRWLARLRAHPEVELQRGGELVPYRASVPAPDDALRGELLAAMEAKYGFAHRVVTAILRGERAVPVRLDPDPTREPRRARGGAHGEAH